MMLFSYTVLPVSKRDFLTFARSHLEFGEKIEKKVYVNAYPFH